MKLKLIAVGGLKQEYAQLGCALFEKRLSHMCRFEHIEVRDAKRKGSDVARWRAQEADQIRQALSGVSTWIALDERGDEWSSERLAREIQECQTRSHSALAFVIGGPDGFDPALLKSAPKQLRLGKIQISGTI